MISGGVLASNISLSYGLLADIPLNHKKGAIYVAIDTYELYTCFEDNKWSNPEPVGTIKLWYGEAINAPDGWVICDGTNGTPDLRGRIPVGISTSDSEFDALGKTGGSKATEAHEHNVTMNIYSMTSGTGRAYGTAGSSAGSGSVQSASFGTGDSGNLQPYLCLHYIMKVQ